MRPALAALLILSLSACRTPSGDSTAALAGANDAATDNGKAEIVTMLRADVDELSGFDGQVDASGKIRIAAIGDAGFKIAFAEFEADFVNKKERTVNVKSLLSGAGNASQWEGVASDASGKIFVLEESPGTIFVFDADAKTLLQKIKLDFGGEFEVNSLGEGLVLLKDGHILVLKEKKPAMLVEFGPAGSEAVGVSSDNIIEKNEPFALVPGDKIKYKPLKSWDFTAKAEELMADFSELAVGPGGVLYLLSDESGRIGRLESKLRTDEKKVNVKAFWDLPKKIEHPEALIFIGTTPVVGIDTKSKDDNVFILAPLVDQ